MSEAAGFDRLVLLAQGLGTALERRGWQVATAESCTGGLVAAAITAVPGSSGWFDRGVVSYSNEAKQELLGVPEGVLAVHGAVSAATAKAMVLGVLRVSRADLAVAITGVAGPGGGTADKPVGLVHLAFARRDGPAETAVHRFPGDRAAVRLASVQAALTGLLARAQG